MTAPRHIAVLDIGKTNVKLALVDTRSLVERQVLTRANHVLRGPPYPHYDTEGIWQFLLDGLRDLHADARIDAVTVTAHGASGVLLAADGGLAAPVIDYEFEGPDALSAEYDALRPDFTETGSPRLPRGLNVGAQVHWQLANDPGLAGRVAQFVTWPQYWVGRLTGRFVCEVSSLGAHTDLWNPTERRFSALAGRLGLRMAPLAPASEVIGRVLPKIAARAGLTPGTPVYCGLHDSNASLYPHLLNREAPFAVVSTGTWVIAMAIGGALVPLDPARDTLMNVNAFGDPVPSARFMGGREFDLITGGQGGNPSDTDVAAVLAQGAMPLPSFEPTSGPFMGRKGGWTSDPAMLSPGEKAAAASLYVALMTAECLRLIGAQGPVLMEGPFARNPVFCRMLAIASDRAVLPSDGGTGTAIGAALLAGSDPPKPAVPFACPEGGEAMAMAAYAAQWRRTLAI